MIPGDGLCVTDPREASEVICICSATFFLYVGLLRQCVRVSSFCSHAVSLSVILVWCHLRDSCGVLGVLGIVEAVVGDF